VYNDPSGHLSFWYASEWQIIRLDVPLPVLTIIPDPVDPLTQISIMVKDVGSVISAADHAAVVEGVQEGLAQLDGCVVDYLRELNEGERWGVEWMCSFMHNGQRYRRRARLFFSDQYQYSVVLQGSTEERYAYWQGMFEFTMLTVGTAPFNLKQWTQSVQLEESGPTS